MKNFSAKRALYVHIPFCQTRCSYCAFTSQAAEQTPAGQIDRYLEALYTEFDRAPNDLPLTSVFIGGGTPSLLSPHQFHHLCQSIREHWDVSYLTEWTTEMNPGSANLLFIETALDCGVNRFSLGVQSFSETTLQQLQREHVPSDIFQTMTELRDCGATNVNLDLIYGVPDQTAQSFADDLDRLLSLSPNHVSLYNLQFEEGTGLRDRLDQGLVSELEEKTQIDMYNQACSKMDSEGMPQYEISSFSAPDKRCQHNLTYWRNEEYIGAGAGAYGFLSRTRYRNHCMVERYITSVESGQAPRAEEDALEDSQILVETLITGLRLREGIDWDDLEGRFTTEVTSSLREVCEGHVAAGLMERIGGAKARLTPAGLLVSNAIFETLV